MMNTDLINDPVARERAIRSNVWWGMGLNILLTLCKLVVGFLTQSRALISDAVHSFSDFFTDGVILVGSRYWSQPPDAGHPYGHRRIETLITALVGGVLAVAGFVIGADAIGAILHADKVEVPGWSAFWIAILSIFSKEWLYRWTTAVGRRTGSLALQANAWHHRSDAISSIPVALAIAASHISPSLRFLDSVGALVVSGLLMQVAWHIMRPAFGELAEIGAPKALTDEIERLARAVPGVKDVHSIRTHYYGAKLFVDMHILVDPSIPVREGHAIASRVCDALHGHYQSIFDVLTHLEPYEPGVPRQKHGRFRG